LISIQYAAGVVKGKIARVNVCLTEEEEQNKCIPNFETFIIEEADNSALTKPEIDGIFGMAPIPESTSGVVKIPYVVAMKTEFKLIDAAIVTFRLNMDGTDSIVYFGGIPDGIIEGEMKTL